MNKKVTLSDLVRPIEPTKAGDRAHCPGCGQKQPVARARQPEGEARVCAACLTVLETAGVRAGGKSLPQPTHETRPAPVEETR